MASVLADARSLASLSVGDAYRLYLIADMLKFFGSTVKAYTQDDVEVIGIGDDEEFPDDFIILTRYDDPGAPESPRDEMVGIQTSDSDYEVAAALSAIKLSRNSIEIEVVDGKEDEVGVARMSVQFIIGEDDFAVLREYVVSICRSTSIKLTL